MNNAINCVQEVVPAQKPRLTVRASFVSPVSSEGGLCDPPAIVQKQFAETSMSSEPFWLAPSPVSDPTHQIEALRAAWREMTEILANRPVAEVPEVFAMPPAPTVRVRGRVRRVYQAPFVFVDDLADQADE